MRPEDQAPPPGEDEGDAGGAASPEGPPSPPPATWAGRARAGQAKAEEQPAGGAGPAEEQSEGGAGPAGESTSETDDRGEEPPPAKEGAEQAVAAGETVEADTLATADREAAEEAALAGLRARAARQEAKRESDARSATASQTSATADSAPDAADAGDGEPEQPEPEQPEPEQPEPEPAEVEKAPRPKALWARFLAASLLIIVSTAAATAVALLLVLDDLAQGIGGITDVEQELTPVGGGDPQTLLILGSDQRAGAEGGDEGGARSDTAILLRVDPENQAIRLLSIPRDLRANIPGVGVDKFNAAYTHGGPRLALRVIKQLTGLEINHVVNIDFRGFAETVNSIDCVYIDIDRRYYIPPDTGVAEIDVDAGYQRLCGLKALQYVRFRHEDNDLVRAARQQDFLREARQKIPPSKLIENHSEFLDIFKQYTTSSESLANPIQLLELLKTFLGARNAAVTEIHFPAQLGGPRSPYVTANQRAVRETVERFLGEDMSPSPRPGAAGGGGGGGDRDEGGNRRQRQQRQQQQPPPEPEVPMVDSGGTVNYAQMVAGQQTEAGRTYVDFPVEYPGQVPARTSFGRIDDSRAFDIDGITRAFQGYKLVFGVPGQFGFTEYWGVSGTNWSDPPILENPSDVREIAGHERMLFYDGDRLRLVGWKRGRNTYWVQNTLLQSLSEAEMLAIVRSMAKLEN